MVSWIPSAQLIDPVSSRSSIFPPTTENVPAHRFVLALLLPSCRPLLPRPALTPLIHLQQVEPESRPVVLVERDPDFLLVAKQGLFPFVSTSVVTVRHPLCAAVVADGGRHSAETLAAFLREWRVVWDQVLIGQVPLTKGDVWAVR